MSTKSQQKVNIYQTPRQLSKLVAGRFRAIPRHSRPAQTDGVTVCCLGNQRGIMGCTVKQRVGAAPLPCTQTAAAQRQPSQRRSTSTQATQPDARKAPAALRATRLRSAGQGRIHLLAAALEAAPAPPESAHLPPPPDAALRADGDEARRWAPLRCCWGAPSQQAPPQPSKCDSQGLQ